MGHGGHSFAFGHLRAEKMDLGFSGAPRSEVLSSSSSSAASSAGNNYIEHIVSKLDTLAGIAIKYGVEVSDIKRMNGLTTDLQMFAHKTLHIPLPGRHPPSAALSRNPRTSSGFPSVQPPGYGIHASYANGTSDSINGHESKKSAKRPVSVAMNLLRGYYGLSQSQMEGNEGTEMTVYKTDCEPSTAPQTHANYRSEDLNKMFKSYYNGDLLMKAEKDLMDDDSLKTNGSLNMGLVGDAGFIENEKTNESSVRRRSKGEGIDYLLGATETVLKQESSSTGRGGKGLSLRPKSGSKGSLSNDATGAFDYPFTISDPNLADALVVGVSAMKGLGDSPGNGKTPQNFMSKVRRSSSTPSLQDSGKISPLKSVSRSAAKGESQGLLTLAVSRPLFDGIPRPLNGWRNKAALD